MFEYNFEYKSGSTGGRIILNEVVESTEGPVASPGYTILWNRSGRVDINVDGKVTGLNPDNLFFVSPHRYYDVKIRELSQLYIIEFDRDFYSIEKHDSETLCNGILFNGLVDTPRISLKQNIVNDFGRIFSSLVDEFSREDSFKYEMMVLLLKRLLLMSVQLAKTTIDSYIYLEENQVELVRNFSVMVEKHFRESREINYYADLLNKAPKTISNVFAKFSEKSPLQLINERVVIEAKKIFRYSEKSVKDVASELGFPDPAYFSAFFKKHAGETVTDYINNIRGKNLHNNTREI
ncbi:MAG: helix-turn-helix domain-containing protein [Ignavibacteriaceae bacterium]|nr:helix-turn-helix domain-containing protein [Ignavibacteriaceae bacterium]